MKIEIDSFEELHELSRVVVAGVKALRDMRDQDAEWAPRSADGVVADCRALLKEWTKPECTEVATSVEAAVQGTSEALRSGSVDHTGPALPEEAAQAPEFDADGRRWDERRDSSNKGLNKDGTWRARRNHGLSDEELERIKAEGIAAGKAEREAAEPDPETDDAGAVTETHPLPTEVEETPGVETRDYTGLILKAAIKAEDQKDGLLDVLNAAKEFVKTHSPRAWTEFSEAIVPGKSVQGYEPAERRLILAAIEVYNAESAS